MNVWERVLEVWLKKHVEIDEMQFWLYAGRGTTDAIVIAMQEQLLARYKTLYLRVVYFEKAFD